MDTAPPDYWFSAKRYGWGWTLNSNWRGWATLAVFLVAVALGIVFGSPHFHPVGFGLYILGLIAALTAVCWVKGEPPGWHWGD